MGSLSIKTNFLWNSAGALTYSGCQWLITVLVVRLSPDYNAAGVLALAMAVSNVFAPIALYKIRAYQVSDVHEKTSSGEYVGFRFVTIGLAFAVTLIYSVITCSPSSLPCVALYLLFRAGDCFIDVLHGIDQQHFRMDYCGQSLATRGILFVSSFSIILKLTGNLEAAVLGMSLATYPVILFDLSRANTLSSVRPIFSKNKSIQLLSRCFPAVLGMALCNYVVTFARQYLGALQGDAALGIYASVCTPVVLIQACSNYVYAPLLGVFAKYLDENDIPAFNSLLIRVLSIFALIFLGGALAFFLFGEWFLELVFGPDIASYSGLMYAAILSCAFTACVAFLGDLLISMREMSWNLIGNAVSCLASIPLTILLVNVAGMNGVSFSIASSYCVGVVIMLVRIIKMSKSRNK